MRTFLSDNSAGLCPEALAAIIEANDGSHRTGYGEDAFTARAVEAFAALFGPAIDVGFVATGTAANVLALAALSEPWQQVICHRHSHLNDDESTAPERVARLRTVAVGRRPDRLEVVDVQAVASNARGDVHQAQPGVVTISNPTEFGTLYAPEEVRAIGEAAHEAGYRLHVDGARFANAVAALSCDPRALTAEAGVDALSFGGTKNGLAAGEAVVFFRQGDGRTFERARRAFAFHRKGTGHLLSKHRFVTAPFAATLAGGAWLRHAAHANAMGRHLGEALAALELPPVFPVECNGVFVRLPAAVDRALREAGHDYYPFGDRKEGISRLMCSFDTQVKDVETLVDCVRAVRPA